jgi:hypothetical protein
MQRLQLILLQRLLLPAVCQQLLYRQLPLPLQLLLLLL